MHSDFKNKSKYEMMYCYSSQFSGRTTDDQRNQSSIEMYDDENNKWITMPSINGSEKTIGAFEIPCKLAKAILSKTVP